MKVTSTLVGLLSISALVLGVPFAQAASKSLAINDLKLVAEKGAVSTSGRFNHHEEHHHHHEEHHHHHHHHHPHHHHHHHHGIASTGNADFASPQVDVKG